MNRIKLSHGQTLFLLLICECWQVDGVVAVELQLSGTWNEYVLDGPRDRHTISDNLFELSRRRAEIEPIHCVLVDEAQFLTKAQVNQLTDVADELDIPVLVYGLRTDFQGNLFEGSKYLLAWADNLVESKTLCHCGRKATMVLRVDRDGNPVRDGDQVKIGGNESYNSVCRKHFKEGIATRTTRPLPFKD